jgi:hypothetical protein
MRKPQLSECCIYCDYHEYYDLVKEQGVKLVHIENQKLDEDEKIDESDWAFFFLHEAIEIASNNPNVETECIRCSDGYDD